MGKEKSTDHHHHEKRFKGVKKKTKSALNELPDSKSEKTPPISAASTVDTLDNPVEAPPEPLPSSSKHKHHKSKSPSRKHPKRIKRVNKRTQTDFPADDPDYIKGLRNMSKQTQVDQSKIKASKVCQDKEVQVNGSKQEDGKTPEESGPVSI